MQASAKTAQEFFLVSLPDPSASGTVHDNGLADNLYGGPGMDWFFTGMMDVIFNKTSGEGVTQI